MKLLRVGAPGAEKPAALVGDGDPVVLVDGRSYDGGPGGWDHFA